MTQLSMMHGLVAAGFAIALAGCSSSSDSSTGGKCSAPVITGSPAFSSGTGSVHGSGTLPASVPSNQEIQLEVDTPNGGTGVLPTNLLDEPLTCGSAFTYTITNVEAGTYSLGYNIYDPKSQSGDATMMGDSTNTFTIADGQSVEFNPTF
jgi:hypothetical protein